MIDVGGGPRAEARTSRRGIKVVGDKFIFLFLSRQSLPGLGQQLELYCLIEDVHLTKISQLARSTHSHCNAARMAEVQAGSELAVDGGTKSLSSNSNIEAVIEELDISRIERIYKYGLVFFFSFLKNKSLWDHRKIDRRIIPRT
jgi:hypothetical protein